jgi:polyisoprenoid-binding protein YceI
MTRSRRALIAGAAALLLIVVLTAVAVAVLTRVHNAPPQLALSTAAPSGSASALAGKWTVASGSQVGYRAKEKFINQPAETEAVARTSKVTGSLVVSIQGDMAKITQMKFSVDLASLVSQDRYATYQVYQRDFFIRTIYLQADQFPSATFTADTVTVPLPATGPVNADIDGKLSVHGNAKGVTAHVQAQAAGQQAEVAGSMTVDMRDFGIEPPDISFTRAEPVVTIEYDLKLIHA